MTLRYEIYDGINLLLNTNMEYTNPNNFDSYLDFFMKKHTLNLFLIYTATIVRRDFLQMIYFDIIPLEKYLLSFIIEFDERENKMDRDKKKIALIKTFMIFYSLNHLIEEIYNKHVRNIFTTQIDNLSHYIIPESLIYSKIDRLETLIHTLVEYSQVFDNSNYQKPRVYGKYIQLKKNFPTNIKIYLSSVFFADSSNEILRIIEEMEEYFLYKEQNNEYQYKIHVGWFYCYMIEYLLAIFDLKMNFENNKKMWQDILQNLEHHLKFVEIISKSFINNSDINFFENIYYTIKADLIKTFKEKKINIICRSSDTDILNRYLCYTEEDKIRK